MFIIVWEKIGYKEGETSCWIECRSSEDLRFAKRQLGMEVT